ncbi:MAG: hypothetical protein WBR24_06305 [Desulfobacterales bacterium]|jgi:hypothetical protein
MPFTYSYQPQVLILRYYSCFFNSLDPAIVLVFFSSSGKNVGQNKDPSSFLGRGAAAGATTRKIQIFLRVFALSAGRLNAQNHHLIFMLDLSGRQVETALYQGHPSRLITNTTDQ